MNKQDWSNLPDILWYKIFKYEDLLPSAIINLSVTCKKLNNILNTDQFWSHLIYARFGWKLGKHYLEDIFMQNNVDDEHFLLRTDEDEIQIKHQFSLINEMDLSKYKFLYLNDDINFHLAYVRTKLFESIRFDDKKQINMATTIDFVNKNLSYYKFNSYKKNTYYHSLHKLIYFYLIDCKRVYAIDTVLFRKWKETTSLYSIREKNVVFLHGGDDFVGDYIVGKFKSILPGTYQIICRLKLITYKNISIRNGVICLFHAYADYCVNTIFKMYQQEWFAANENSDWFLHTMGTLMIYDMSTIYFKLRYVSTKSHEKYILLCDYIELKIIHIDECNHYYKKYIRHH
ncbi:unnamed protein product [Didymodactylos carnosus]|uniref:F-box domain-containing protein n=1 Tax=Didymodactylos carnosus TaxID=1234261 RepID=A0A8S2K9N7_9BILA|nr:unnamed protein product [Didymodactylos carnosus]CAF3844064.1 unnamed protein product [Didymodactylos carnosus]